MVDADDKIVVRIEAPGMRREDFHVELDARAQAGTAQWIPLPSVQSGCVTVALDETERGGAGDETGFAELRVYTAADLGGMSLALNSAQKVAIGEFAISRPGQLIPARRPQTRQGAA